MKIHKIYNMHIFVIKEGKIKFVPSKVKSALYVAIKQCFITH